MELDYSPFWFMVLMLIGFFFIGLSVFFAFQIAFGFDYDECLQTYNSTLVCDMFIPPLNIQGA